MALSRLQTKVYMELISSMIENGQPFKVRLAKKSQLRKALQEQRACTARRELGRRNSSVNRGSEMRTSSPYGART